MSTEYDKEAARLAKLPRSQRFEALIAFPAKHTFKVIGKSDGFADAVATTLELLGYGRVTLIERPSSRGRYVSISFHLQVESGEELDRAYSALEKLEGVAYLL